MPYCSKRTRGEALCRAALWVAAGRVGTHFLEAPSLTWPGLGPQEGA
jgi:hypothetical protein